MLEVLRRSAMGRETLWSTDGLALRTPLVLATESERFAPPPSAAAVLSDRPRSRPTFVDSGSVFLPRAADAPFAIPPTRPAPPSVAALEIPLPATGGRVAPADAPLTEETEVVLLTNLPDTLRNPREFVRQVATARTASGYRRPLYAPGIATPASLPLLAYCGIDIVDDTRVLLEAGWGRLHTAEGWWTEDPAKAACDCLFCSKEEPRPYGHNAHALQREVRTVRAALAAGRLRELAEARAVADSWQTAVLRHLDLREHEWQERHFPVVGGETEANAPAAMTRPDIVRFRRWIRERYRKPPSARVLVLLPCSARKPYSESQSHRRFRAALRETNAMSLVHEVVTTVPLGVVPRELERFHPVSGYDLAVTGDWSRDEAHILEEALRAYVEQNPYDAIVTHVHAERSLVEGVLGDRAVYTADDRPTEPGALARLTAAVKEATAGLRPPRWDLRWPEEMRNIARVQFGLAVGEALLEEATLQGRWPFVRILSRGRQVGTFTERGRISLTLEGAGVLSRHSAFCVEIEDFEPQGNIFAVGVTGATDDIRIGDEVAVRHGGEVRAVGTASMNPREMIDLRRGEAVHVRSKRAPGKAF